MSKASGACGGDEFGRDRESDLVYGTFRTVGPRIPYGAVVVRSVEKRRMGLVSTTTSQEAPNPSGQGASHSDCQRGTARSSRSCWSRRLS